MLGPFGLSPKATMLRRAMPAARALARRGHEVIVIMPPWHTPGEGGRAWSERVPGAPVDLAVDLVAVGGPGIPGLYHGLVAARMVQSALRFQPDVVHAFKPKAYSGLADALLHARRGVGRARRCPALVMDTDDWEGPGGWNDIEGYSAAQRWLFARQERWGLAHADAVTVASRTLESLVWSMGVPPRRVTYLPNAIQGYCESGASDGDALDAGAGASSASANATRDIDVPTRDDRPPTLLLYTRFFEYDLRRPLEVLGRVRQDWPAARLIVAGKGLHGEEREFLAAAAAQGLAEAVDYRGWVEPEAVAALFAEADVALYPFDDTLVNRTKSAFKLLELMQASLPVVAEAVGQNAEVIEDGRSGRLVASGDVAALADAVGALLGSREARDAMGAAARARVETHYNWERQVVDLEAVYRRAMEA